ncbi:MAG: hypothetical protein HGA53_10870, partial [Anaerolineaceae bacterium]|nr:hypothetical protein [Anaerolineaceae bacterium]
HAPVVELPKKTEVVEQPPLPRIPPPSRPSRPAATIPPPPRRIGPKVAQGGKKLVGFTASVSAFWNKIGAGLNSFTARVLPGTAQKVPALSSGALWFIAIAVPLVVVAIATTVYLRTSGGEQQRTYLDQAIQYAAKAETSTENTTKRSSWMQSNYWLGKAEQYGITDETRQLRLRVENGLDQLDNISRLDLTLALNDTFADKINITQLAYSGNDLYALDAASGRVIRLLLTSNGYSYDAKFTCDPKQMASAGMTTLVDLVALPVNNAYQASVAAIDQNGFMLYCGPDMAPKSIMLPTPGSGWGTIVAMTLNQETLYVLDVKNNAVWRFEGKDSQFDAVPSLFFDNKVPARMTEMIDLAVAGDELFLLRNTGQMVTCTYSGLKLIKPTECKDPAKYTDNRPESSGSTLVMENTGFTQLIPSSNGFSIYILDPKGKSIYSFSMKLNLVKILFMRLADGSTLANKELTAFTIGPGDLTFAAFGDEVYSARIK